MSIDDLKKIGDLISEKINKALEPVLEKLDALWEQTEKLTVGQVEMQETLDSHSAILKSHSRTLESHTAALDRIEAKVENNSDDIHKINKRLTL